MPPPPPPPPPPLPKLVTAPAPVASKSKNKKNSAPAKKDTVKKAGPPPPPPSRDPATHLMNRGSISGPETAPKPRRRSSQESVGLPEVAPKPKRQSSQDGRPPSVNSNGRPPSVNSRPPSVNSRPPSVNSRPPSVNSRPPSVNSRPPSRPPSVPKRQSSTQLSDSSPVSDNPSPPMTMPTGPTIPAPPPPPPLPALPISEAVYESVDTLVASGNLQIPPPSKPLVSQSNEPGNYDEEEEALYDFIPPPAVKPKPKRTSTTSSIQSNTSDIMITKAERDAIRRVSAVITDELLQQDEQLARASFHPTVGDTEMIDDDVYDDLDGEVYDDTMGANEKAAQFRQSMTDNASLTAVVPQPPAPPPVPGYNNEDELYEDTVSAGEKAMEYKQHVMPNLNTATSPPPDMNAVYEEPKPPPAAPPPPPVVPPSVSHQQAPPKAPPPPPVAQPFIPEQDYDELPPPPVMPPSVSHQQAPPKAPPPPPVAQPFVPEQDYDELPPPKAPATPPGAKVPPKAPLPPPVAQPFVPDQDYDELPPPKASAAPSFVPDQDYDELPPPKAPQPPPIVQPFVTDQIYDELPPKAPVPPPAADQDYDDLPPPRPAVTQPTAMDQDDMIYDQLPPAPKSQLPPPSQVMTDHTALEGDIYDVLPPKATTTASHVDMDYDELPPGPSVSSTGYAAVRKNRTVEQKPDATPELDVLGQLVQDVPQESQDNVNEFNTLDNVLSNMGANEDKSSSDEGKWDLPSGDDEEDEGDSGGTRGDDDLLDDWLNDLNSTYPAQQDVKQQITPRPSSAKLAQKCASWRMSMAAFTEAGDPDLDSLLADLCKLEEETAAAAAVGDTRPPTILPSDAEQMSGEEFASFMQSLQQSKNIIHDPISLAIYDTVKLKEQPANQQPPKSEGSPEQHKEQKNVNEKRRASKPAPLQHTGHLEVHRPPSLSTPLSPSHEQVQQQLELFAQQLELDESLTPVEKEKRLQTEKIRIAMNKLKEARIKKMVLKAISIDGSSKMAVVDENMNARDSCVILAEKNHQNFGPNWTLVERLEDFELERPLEDHEKVIEALSHWPKVHRNTVHFRNNPNKYLLLTRPQMLVPDSHSLSAAKGATYFSEEKKKNMILNEMFKDGTIPKVEGELYFKDGKKAGWKKHLFGIRSSGFYMSKSGKSMSSKDVQRVATWSEVFVYNGTKDFKKRYKAPSNLYFSLVPMGPIEKVYPKIKHFCLTTGTKHDLDVWMTGIRVAKFGKQLVTDYETTKEKCPWMQLEEDQEFENEKKATEDTTSDLNTATEEELSALRTDIVQKVAEVTKKSKFGSVSMRFQSKKNTVTSKSAVIGSNLNVPSGSKPPSARASQASVDQADTGHIITGPVITGPVGTGSTRSRQAKQRSVLKEAFKNAWKQGNITSQVGVYDEEQWPTFSTKPAPVFVMEDDLVEDSPKMGHRRLGGDTVSMSGEMSGMVTLKRGKKAKDAGATREDEQAAQGNSSPSQGTPSDAQSISSDSNSLVFQMHKEMEGQDKRASTVSIETAI